MSDRTDHALDAARYSLAALGIGRDEDAARSARIARAFSLPPDRIAALRDAMREAGEQFLARLGDYVRGMARGFAEVLRNVGPCWRPGPRRRRPELRAMHTAYDRRRRARRRRNRR